nr:probable acyl-activating enzyme 2 [Tanacetum cinerariifolium]
QGVNHFGVEDVDVKDPVTMETVKCDGKSTGEIMFRGNTVMSGHQAVLEVAVVARPDDHWGQTPCAFVKLKESFHVNAQEIIQHCRDHMPQYMSPRTVIFQDLPRNSTGKVEKFVLREKAESLGSLSHQQV